MFDEKAEFDFSRNYLWEHLKLYTLFQCDRALNFLIHFKIIITFAYAKSGLLFDDLVNNSNVNLILDMPGKSFTKVSGSKVSDKTISLIA